MKRAITYFFMLLFLAFVFRNVYAQSTLGAEQLYQKWSQNNRTEHSIAYQAAEEYITRFPTGQYAEQLRAWAAAYEKASAINQGALSNKEQVEKQRESALKEMLALLTTYIEEHGVDGPRYSVLGRELPNMLYWTTVKLETQIDGDSCRVKISQATLAGRFTKDEMRRINFTVPLDKVDPDTVLMTQDPKATRCCDAKGADLVGRPVFVITMKSKGDEKVVSFSMTEDGKSPKSGYIPVAGFELMDRKVAADVRDGFKRVVKLCGEQR
jgi:hypothetical protein